MRFGIRTAKACVQEETTATSGEGAGRHPMVSEDEREREQATRIEDFALMGAGEPYRPRHAADAAEAPLESGELPLGLRQSRHRH